LVDRAVRLVDHDDVEVPHAKAALAVCGLVNEAHHRGVGGHKHAAFGVLVGHQIHGR